MLIFIPLIYIYVLSTFCVLKQGHFLTQSNCVAVRFPGLNLAQISPIKSLSETWVHKSSQRLTKPFFFFFLSFVRRLVPAKSVTRHHLHSHAVSRDFHTSQPFLACRMSLWTTVFRHVAPPVTLFAICRQTFALFSRVTYSLSFYVYFLFFLSKYFFFILVVI